MTDYSPTHWEDQGLPVLRALLAEGVAAELGWRTDSDTTWRGGQTKGADVFSQVEGQQVRRDAKSIRVDVDNDELVLARRNAKPFSAVAAEILTLVELHDGQSKVQMDLDAGTAEVTASATIHRVWEVPVEAMNRLMPDERDPEIEAPIRNVLIPLDDLADFQVIPPN